MTVFIVTQTFAPQTGGMEGVMTALAENFSAYGEEVIVLPDKPHSANGYQTVQKNRLKFRRAATKRSWLKGRLTATDIVICDSWKSVAAVPPHHGKLVVLAHGQEYLKSGRRARRVQKALNRATHLVASSQYTLNLVEKGWKHSTSRRRSYRPPICWQMIFRSAQRNRPRRYDWYRFVASRRAKVLCKAC